MGKLQIYFIKYFFIYIVILLHCNTFVAQTVVPAHGKESSLKLLQSVPTRTIEFAGMTWYVRNTNGAPGPNNWSDKTENVWVDSIGCLHLKIRKENNIWYCSEIYSQKLCSYGEYTFFTASNFDNYDRNIVAGFFVYQDDNNEIDIEFSKFGNINNYRGWYVNQSSTEESTHGFDLNLNGNYSTHKFIWNADSIFFQSYHGHYPTLPSSNFLIEEWNYTGNNIPIPDNERIYINFWLFQGNAPDDQNEAELIITDFWPPNTKDFSISNTSLSKTSISPDEQLTASCEQQYTGNCQSALNSKVGYYLSSDTQLDTSDILLGESDSNFGPTQSSEHESCVLTMPSTILPGKYYILFVADYQNLFEEKNEQNNISSIDITVIPPSYSITALPEHTLGCTIEGAGIYTKGTNCSLSATPQTGYEFVNWTENENQISRDSTFSFIVDHGRNLVANFQVKSSTQIKQGKMNLTFSPNPTNGILHIRNDFLNARSITIKVFTINGTIVFIKNLQSKSDIELNFEFLNKGFYFIQVTNGNLIQTEKLIIN